MTSAREELVHEIKTLYDEYKLKLTNLTNYAPQDSKSLQVPIQIATATHIDGVNIDYEESDIKMAKVEISPKKYQLSIEKSTIEQLNDRLDKIEFELNKQLLEKDAEIKILKDRLKSISELSHA
jgi:hypothetical protein